MNKYDQQLIVDLLGGGLSQDEERAALDRIDKDPSLRAEYESQLSAMSILGASPIPMMTADERTALHSSLRKQLHLDDAPVPVVAAPSRWQRWWAPIGGLAVAAAVVFGAVVVLPGALSGGVSDAEFQTASAELTTTAPSASSTEDVAGTFEDESSGDNSAVAAAPEAAGGASDEEDSAGAETQAVDTFEAAVPPSDLPYLTDVDLDVLGGALPSESDSLRSNPSVPSSKSAEFGAELVNVCLDSLRVDSPASEFSPIALTTYESIPSVVVSISPSVGEDFVAVYSVASCQELASTQG
ncbi:MAG: hypothetical protein U9N78_05495 [Actinomycetota bacterium]|nr:hypothetical protein [Actinomycetota bacterium]